MLLRDNVYGTIDEDAERRDFTINSMYYNIADYSIHDYARGIEDLEDRLVRLIGDPETRYREDPVRMLRAIRFAVKLDFDIEEDTAAPIEEMAPLLRDIPSARLFEESLKMLQSGHGLETYHLLREYNLFQQLFPAIAEHFTEDYESHTEQMLDLVLDSTDMRIEEGKRINPAFMFAAMLWYPLCAMADKLMEQHNLCHYDAIMEASNIILDDQVRTLRFHAVIPRQFVKFGSYNYVFHDAMANAHSASWSSTNLELALIFLKCAVKLRVETLRSLPSGGKLSKMRAEKCAKPWLAISMAKRLKLANAAVKPIARKRVSRNHDHSVHCGRQ